MKTFFVYLWIFLLSVIQTLPIFPQDNSQKKSGELAPPSEDKPSIVLYFNESLGNKLEYYLERKFQEADIPGGILVVTEGDRVVYMKGIGYSNKRRGHVFTPKTVFNAGTFSGHLTNLGILKLVEEEFFSLQTPLSEVLPDLRIGYEGNEKILTIESLLHNTTGLSFRSERILRKPDGSFALDSEKIISSLSNLRDLKMTNDVSSENNLDFIISAEIIQKKAKQPIFYFLKNRIFNPLEMQNTDYSLYAVRKKDVSGFGFLWGKMKEISLQEVPEVFNPSQKIFTTGEDISRILLLHTSYREDLPLPRTRISDMYSQQARQDFTDGHNRGMGFQKKDLIEDTVYYINTSGIGSSGSFYILTKKKIAFALFTNSSVYPATWTIAEGLLAILHNREPIEIPLVKKEKTIGLFGLFLLLLGFLLSVGNAYLVMKSFSPREIEYTGEDRLPMKFILSLSLSIFLVWVRFLFLPNSDLLGIYTMLPYDSSPGGWMPELYYGFAILIMSSMMYLFYFGYLLLKSSRNRTR